VQFMDMDRRAGRSSTTSSRRVRGGPRAHDAGRAMSRPSIFDLEAAMSRLEVPTLIMTGDEDDLASSPPSS